MTYVLDNAHTAAATRLAALEELYDPLTRANLYGAEIGGPCDVWEVGCGRGSIAQWLAYSRARVTATDIDLRHLTPQARDVCRVIEHDVVADDPPGTFDLIHARLVVSHLPAWPQVLPRLVEALRPSGWLVVEELDPMLDYLPDAPADHLINRVGHAFTAALAHRGGAPTLGRHLPGLFASCGLGEIAATATILGGWGGGTIANLMIANTTQTAPILAAAGINDDELAAYQHALGDPAQWITMPTFWAARGQVPA
jgi:SAM-dependent methyltransferase